MSPTPGFDDLQGWLQFLLEARSRIGPQIRETPLVTSYTFSEGAGRDVRLKLENLQRTGAFKIRGALNKLLQLPRPVLRHGVVAASAGNHAQGLALAARLAGSKATIVMPESTARIKVRRTEDYGAEVLLVGQSWDESHAHATQLAEERDLLYVHPFDDADIIAGQGSVGLELLEQLPEVRTVVVPIGGGGLAAGVAVAVRALRPEVRIVGVQAEGAPAMARSLSSGQRTVVDSGPTIAEGIRVGAPGELTYELISRYVDDCVTVTEPQIIEAVLALLEKSKVVCEAAGSVAAAALACGLVGGEDPACAVLSGGNIDLTALGRLIRTGLSQAGFYHPLVVRMPDQPGTLQEILRLLGEAGANVVEVEHRRAPWRVPSGLVDVEILIETRSEDQGQVIEEQLRQSGYELPFSPPS